MSMRRIALLGVAVCLAFAGCESTRQGFATGVKEKFSGPTYERRVFSGESGAVFESAKAVVTDMGFRITRAGAAQGVIEAVSGISSDDRLRGSRQRTIKVRFSSATDSGVEVAVLFTEIVEDDFNKGAGLGAESSLRGSALYPAFFDRLTLLLAK